MCGRDAAKQNMQAPTGARLKLGGGAASITAFRGVSRWPNFQRSPAVRLIALVHSDPPVISSQMIVTVRYSAYFNPTNKRVFFFKVNYAVVKYSILQLVGKRLLVVHGTLRNVVARTTVLCRKVWPSVSLLPKTKADGPFRPTYPADFSNPAGSSFLVIHCQVPARNTGHYEPCKRWRANEGGYVWHSSVPYFWRERKLHASDPGSRRVGSSHEKSSGSTDSP